MVLENVQGFETNVAPARIEAIYKTVAATLERPSLFHLIARAATPNFLRAHQTTAKNQTTVQQARIACALERYHTAQGEYPETLTALSPQFLTNIPNDLIGGQPFKYRRNADDSAQLYSVGWNETDDGGTAVMTSVKNSAPELTKGDWVWTISPAK